MKIFVTGATGFLGRHLISKLKNHEVFEASSKNCDLTLPHSLNQFDKITFDQIYHLAAWTQAGDFCLRHPGEQWLINQKINTHVLDWWHQKQPQAKMIAIGTSCSYDPTLPLIEENYLLGKPIDSLFTYAMTKRMLLTGLQALHKQYGLNFLYLVPSTLYGPHYHTDGRQLHFIFDLIRKIHEGKYKNTPVVLWGDGEQKRELIHVDDFVTIMLELASSEQNTLYNIGGGEEHSIKEFASILSEIIGYPFGKITFDTTKYVGAKSKLLSINKLRALLPSFQWRILKDGLMGSYIWYKKHFPIQGEKTCYHSLPLTIH